jgi:hypothetical protein
MSTTSRLARVYLLRPRRAEEQQRLDRVMRQVTQLLPACDGAELVVCRPVVETVAASDDTVRTLALERNRRLDPTAAASLLLQSAGRIELSASAEWAAWQRRAASAHGIYSVAAVPLSTMEVRDTVLVLHSRGADPLMGSAAMIVQAVADLTASTVRALALTELMAEQPDQVARPRPTRSA